MIWSGDKRRHDHCWIDPFESTLHNIDLIKRTNIFLESLFTNKLSVSPLRESVSVLNSKIPSCGFYTQSPRLFNLALEFRKFLLAEFALGLGGYSIHINIPSFSNSSLTADIAPFYAKMKQ